MRNVSTFSAQRVGIAQAYRNGLSIIDGSDILIEDVDIADVNGTAPRSGVDVEPGEPTQALKNITLRRVSVARVGGRGIELKHAWAQRADAPVEVSMVVEDCSVRDADRAGLAPGPLMAGAQGHIAVRNVSVTGTGCAGIAITDKTAESALLELEAVTVLDTVKDCPSAVIGSYGESAITLNISQHGRCHPRCQWPTNASFGNIRFGEGVRVGSAADPFAQGRPFMQVADVLPVTKPPLAPGASVWRDVGGEVEVASTERRGCAVEAGTAGAAVAVGVKCVVVNGTRPR